MAAIFPCEQIRCRLPNAKWSIPEIAIRASQPGRKSGLTPNRDEREEARGRKEVPQAAYQVGGTHVSPTFISG